MKYSTDPVTKGHDNHTVTTLGEDWFPEKALFEEYAKFGRGHKHDLADFDVYYRDDVRGLKWPVVNGKETHWRFNEKYDPYFNLLYAIVQFAINSGCKQIKLGQTAYWVKQQIGGRPKNVFLFYYCRKRFVHFLLKKFNLIVFPRTILKPINVFNNVKVMKTKTSRYEFAE